MVGDSNLCDLRLRNLLRWTGGGCTSPRQSISSSGGGRSPSTTPFHERKTLAEIRDEHLGFSEKPDFVTAKICVGLIKHDEANRLMYPACPECRKKLIQMTEGWSCEKCDKTFPEPEYRYIFGCSCLDSSATTWCSVFNDEGERLLGIGAADLITLQSEDMDAFEEKFLTPTFHPLLCTLKVKAETVNDEERVKVSIHRWERVDFVAESRNLIAAINSS